MLPAPLAKDSRRSNLFVNPYKKMRDGELEVLDDGNVYKYCQLNNYWVKHHVYLVSEDTVINEGDWYIHNGRKLRRPAAGSQVWFNVYRQRSDSFFQKVEYTTDKSLGLPSINISLIKAIIENGFNTMECPDKIVKETGMPPESKYWSVNQIREWWGFPPLDYSITYGTAQQTSPSKKIVMYSITFNNSYSIVVTADTEEEAIALGTDWAMKAKRSYKTVSATPIVGEVK